MPNAQHERHTVAVIVIVLPKVQNKRYGGVSDSMQSLAFTLARFNEPGSPKRPHRGSAVYACHAPFVVAIAHDAIGQRI